MTHAGAGGVHTPTLRRKGFNSAQTGGTRLLAAGTTLAGGPGESCDEVPPASVHLGAKHPQFNTLPVTSLRPRPETCLPWVGVFHCQPL